MKPCPDFLHSGPDIPWINPECTGIANLPQRAHLHSFENEAQALDGDPEHSAYYQPLDGNWKFRLFPKPAVLEAEVISQALNDSSWESIEGMLNETGWVYKNAWYVSVHGSLGRVIVYATNAPRG